MAAYFKSLEIPEDLIELSDRSAQGTLVYTLATPPNDVSTLDLAARPDMRIVAEHIDLRIDASTTASIKTVSRKEVVLAILQHGRLTELRGSDCSVEVFSRHVELRQRIVAWAEQLHWGWPDGGPAAWNVGYWNKGTPRPAVSLIEAMDDVFANQPAYKIGCYTATKLVMVKGVLDFYGRVRELPGMLDWVQGRLLTDGEPLLNVEPGIAWRFEPEFDPRDAAKPGKIASIIHNVAPRNFVPGDWAVLVNTDPVSRKKIGHEGSNTIYLGGGRFSDYYGDNANHAFSYVEKLDEVFQWRNGVFDFQRDSAKRRPLAEQDLDRLGRSPTRGGLVTSWRITPALFGAATRDRTVAPSSPAGDGDPALSAESPPPNPTLVD
jgi:hypothetical protein